MKSFSFLGHVYETERMRMFVNTGGVMIKIKQGDLVASNAPMVTDQHSLPCVVQYDGKYHAISVPASFRPGAEVNVRMVTKPALKRLKTDF